jgi:hypothetical protein
MRGSLVQQPAIVGVAPVVAPADVLLVAGRVGQHGELVVAAGSL